MVGWPVEGPPLCTFTITVGVSVTAANPMASCISVYPGPDVAVMDLFPPHLAPIMEHADPISSSICMKTPPAFCISPESISIISVEGVMG